MLFPINYERFLDLRTCIVMSGSDARVGSVFSLVSFTPRGLKGEVSRDTNAQICFVHGYFIRILFYSL